MRCSLDLAIRAPLKLPKRAPNDNPMITANHLVIGVVPTLSATISALEESINSTGVGSKEFDIIPVSNNMAEAITTPEIIANSTLNGWEY